MVSSTTPPWHCSGSMTVTHPSIDASSRCLATMFFAVPGLCSTSPPPVVLAALPPVSSHVLTSPQWPPPMLSAPLTLLPLSPRGSATTTPPS